MQSALKELRKQFLPAQFDPTGTYPDRWIARARAYRVLAHAEIEHFLEDRVSDVVKHSLKVWKISQTTSQPLIAILAFSGREMMVPPETLASPSMSATAKHDEQLKLDERIHAASRSFFQALKENHGIKERNLLRLLITVGFLHMELDPVWLANMNSFGEARGEAAHLSARHGTVSHPPDPKSEYDLVKLVLTGLKDIDEKLTALMV